MTSPRTNLDATGNRQRAIRLPAGRFLVVMKPAAGPARYILAPRAGLRVTELARPEALRLLRDASAARLLHKLITDGA